MEAMPCREGPYTPLKRVIQAAKTGNPLAFIGWMRQREETPQGSDLYELHPHTRVSSETLFYSFHPGRFPQGAAPNHF
jgi:hypothetical protein